MGGVKGTTFAQYTEGMIEATGRRLGDRRALRRRLDRALAGCSTEADIVQVLYAEVHADLGYSVVSLQVLEREGRVHTVTVDHGVLQDVRQLVLSESHFARHYQELRPQVGAVLDDERLSRSRGPGEGKRPRTYIWLPVVHRGQVLGAIVYQTDSSRQPPADEVALLEQLQVPVGLAASRATLRARLQWGLANCGTEADIVQTLYVELNPEFGYDVINLSVLEREGRFHSLVVDHGVLQDVRQFLLTESTFADNWREATTSVVHPPVETPGLQRGRGPGVQRRPQTYIWMPIYHRGQLVGAVIYQLDAWRDVPAEEVALLERVHSQMGVLVNNAYLNELTRNQAVRLTALNAIARGLSGTHDEHGVLGALYSTLKPLLAVDMLELTVRDALREGQFRVLRSGDGAQVAESTLTKRSRALAAAQAILVSGRPSLQPPTDHRSGYQSSAWVPILEQGKVAGVLAVHTREPEAYEESTLAFLEQVADEVSLALRNAWSYAAVEAQRRRLEVANAVGRRLASTLDRWSIVRTLREELSRHLDFDIFSLATVAESPDGPTAEAYVYDSGEERQLAPVALADAGPAREAFESGQPVLIRRSRWARSFESSERSTDGHLVGDGAVMYVTRPGNARRIAARSLVWVPVSHGDEIRALLSLQSYHAGAFTDWHVQLLQDVAAHVSLALSTAEHFDVAQTERRRLEALHVLELGAAGASDERRVADALFSAVAGAVDASYLAVLYLDTQGQVTGYATEPGGTATALTPKPLERTYYFKRVMEEGKTIVESTPPELRQAHPGLVWQIGGNRMPTQVIWVPLLQDDRVIGALSAQRRQEAPFSSPEVELLESAAPAVSIALRTVRLHRANELALTHSLRIQEVAALAGNDLGSVLDSVAEQARTMLAAVGTACWAFDYEGRVIASASTGRAVGRRVLSWAGRSALRPWRQPPRELMEGAGDGVEWSLLPLWYADRLVGALGSVHPRGGIEPTPEIPGDLARHAALAIENARLAAEARGRIRTLEAVAAFANLDITRPLRARAQMSRLIEKALSGSHGALWLLEGEEMVSGQGGDGEQRVPSERVTSLLAARKARAAGRELSRALGAGVGARGGVFTTPITVSGRLEGILTADAGGASPAETRRLMGVLAGQAALALGRLRLVGELDRQARMMTNILSHSPVGVVLEDAAGNVVYANPEVERIYGVPAAGLSGAPAEQLLSQVGARVVAGPEDQSEGPLELRLPDSGIIVRVRRVPIPGSEEQPARVLTMHEDVTQEHLVLEAKDLMLRAIGHEVRSPAAAMRSTIASLLQWGELMEPQRRRSLMEEAYEQSDRLLSLVENQLIISKLETRHFEPNPVPMALEEVLEGVVGVLRNRYGNRVRAIALDLEPGLPSVLCEPTHLDQVLTNLIGNAFEYTPANRVTVSARPVQKWLEVTVADDGGGLAPERLQTLFQKTGPAGRNRARGGLGLGLYLCRLVVERSFGGRIWLEQTGPTGTVFKFTVPAAPAVSSRRRVSPPARVAR